MKKIWKALGLTALAAAVIPYRIRRDEVEDVTKVDALMWQLVRRPGEGEDKNQVDISLGFKSPLQELREEQELFTDDPEEAVLFADDEPEAAVVPIDAVEAAAEKAETIAQAAEEATEEDFDPDL